MDLIAMMDALLRDPNTVYQMAAEGRDLGRLCGRLLLIFVVTSAVYGAVMGSYRCIHPEYHFSSFELEAPTGDRMDGDVAGVNVDTATAYTLDEVPPYRDAIIRFNVSRPSDPYEVKSIGDEQGYTAIHLAADSRLREPNAWMLPLLVAGKTPLLFVLTLAICALALYVLNLAFDVRLHFMPVMTTMSFGLAATGVMLGVLAPIAALFSVVTEDYHFMKLFHLLVFALAGAFGVRILYRGLVALTPEGTRGVRSLVFMCMLLYAVVGSQVAWTLKPFLGTPYLPATPPFRVESGNIYVSFFSSASHVTTRAGRYDSGPRPTRAFGERPEDTWGQRDARVRPPAAAPTRGQGAAEGTGGRTGDEERRPDSIGSTRRRDGGAGSYMGNGSGS